jgi:hypothetical protein
MSDFKKKRTASQKINPKRTIPFLLFVAIFILPSFLMTATGRSSQADGILLCAFAFLAFAAFRNRSFLRSTNYTLKGVVIVLAIAFFIGAHIAINYARGFPLDLGRFVGSYIGLSAMFVGSKIFAERIYSQPQSVTSQYTENTLLFMVANSILGILGISFLAHVTHKPVGIFSEPSHFALALAPLLIYSCIVRTKNHQIYLMFFLVWSLVIQNITTLVVVALAASLIMKVRLSNFFKVGLVFFGLFVFISESEYFSSRVGITSGSDNMSVISLLRGWEIAILTIRDTSYWGGGFQQFGKIGLYGELTGKMAVLDLDGLNIFDGASSAAKVTGEFGIFGVLLVIAYILIFIKCFKIVTARHSRYTLNGGQLFLLSCLLSLSVELFFRGIGYFSAGFFLFFAAAGKFTSILSAVNNREKKEINNFSSQPR